MLHVDFRSSRRYRRYDDAIAAATPGAGVRLLLQLLAASWFALATCAMAQDTKNVLVLYGNNAELPWIKIFDASLRSTVSGATRQRVEFYTEYFDVARFPSPAHQEAFVDLMRTRYADRKIDVVVSGGSTAFDFMISRRKKLFSDVPLVYSFLPPDRAEAKSLPADVVGVPADFSPLPTIELALRLHPGAKRLVLVTGAGPWDIAWENRLRHDTAGLRERVELEFLARLPAEEVFARLSALAKDAIVFTPGFFRDGAGAVYATSAAVNAMVARSTAPLYTTYETHVGGGAVGGVMPTFDAVGRQTGEVVAAVLNGRPPAELKLPRVVSGTTLVDWRQIRRWGIDEELLPPDAEVRFRQSSAWDKYWREISIGMTIVVMQAALILALLVQRTRRRLAEQAVQRHRVEIAHASRLAVAGELTASIAHEINQPLGAILNNVDAAELLMQSGEERQDLLRQILADIRRDDLRATEVIRRLRTLLAKHESEQKPFDLNAAVTETVSLLEMESERRRVTIETQLAPRATVFGDRVQIQQILINLLLNAMDAVSDVGDNRRTIIVSVTNAEDSIIITVRDRGHGIGAEDLPKLFDSFYSTKHAGMGIGLSIARTIVEAHGGRIRAESQPGEGAVFHVELPVIKEMMQTLRTEAAS